MGASAVRRGGWPSGTLPGGDLVAILGLLASVVFAASASVPHVAGLVTEDTPVALEVSEVGAAWKSGYPLVGSEDAVSVPLRRIVHISGPPPGSMEMPVMLAVAPPPAPPVAASPPAGAQRPAPVAEAHQHPTAAPPAPVAPPPAPALPTLPPLVEGAPGTRAVEVGMAALESLDYPWERLGYTIRFLDGRGGVLGMTYPWEKRIDVHVRPGMGVTEVREVLAHELGHAVDAEWMTGREQYDYRIARGLPGDAEWYGCSGCSDFSTPAGDYAEVFALYLTGSGEFSSQVAPAPSPEELAGMERFFRVR